MSPSEQWLLLGVLVILSVLLMYNYIHIILELRNESEYRDIVEYQVLTMAQLISMDPNNINSLSHLRFFPDHSGFFTLMDLNGKVVVHGDHTVHDSDQPLPFDLPVKELLNVAKQGGGYVRYNYKGHMFHAFAVTVPNTNYVLTSGLFVDPAHIKERLKWTRGENRIQAKQVKSYGGPSKRK